MNLSQYEDLCRICDDLLVSSDARVERVAIAWLHIKCERPIFLGQYEFLFCGTTSVVSESLRYFRSYLSARLWGLRQLWRALLLEKRPKFQFDRGSGVDFLFISHYVNESLAKASADFYFGDLPSELASQGASVVIAMINHTGQETNLVPDRMCEDGVQRIVLPLSLDLKGELLILERLRTESQMLMNQAKRSTGLVAKIARWASIAAFSGASRTALRLGIQIADLASNLKIKNLVYTFEGHSWERVSNALVRQVLPDTQFIAYQHAALTRRQHAIRRAMGGVYDPDVILASNRFAVSELSGLVPKSSMIVLGSCRRPGATPLNRRIEFQRERVCLVLPEGIQSECRLLFKFSARCALMYPDILFIWRLHPLLSMTRVRFRDPSLWSLPPNVRISERSLEEDSAEAKWALYRGTTAIAAAVFAGAQPIYVHREGEISCDPLFLAGEFRPVVKQPADLAVVFGSNVICSKDAWNTRDLCQELFPPMRTSKVAKRLRTRT